MSGISGIGKTSFAANFPDAIFIQSRGESGLQTLEAAGIVKANIMPFEKGGKDYLEAQDWNDILDAVEWLTTAEHGFKTLVFDVINGCEKLLHEYTCWKDYGNDWGEKGFMSFQRGFETSLVYLKELINKLDVLRSQRGMTIVMLTHTKVVTFKNPIGADYDKYVPDMHAKSWGLISAWADIVLFANRVVNVETDRNQKKGKADSFTDRVLHTEANPAWDAKNRHNLPPEIPMGESSAECYSNFVRALKESVSENSKANA